MPIYGTYDVSFDEELQPYIARLNAASGEVECRSARILAKKLMEECADFARLSQSRVYENLSFRANVIAFLKACVLYVANGLKLGEDVLTMGIDGTRAALESVEAGTQLASCTCTPYFGPIVVETITKLINGEEVAPAIVNPDTLYTKDNVDVSVGF